MSTRRTVAAANRGGDALDGMTLGEQREQVACILECVLKGVLSSAEAIESCNAEALNDAPWESEVFDHAFHMLQHYHIDEDIRARDLQYAESQRRELLRCIERLRSGK